MSKKLFILVAIFVVTIGAQLLPIRAIAADAVVIEDTFYPQIKDFNYDYVLDKNRFIYTMKIKVRYHRNPASFLQLVYVTPKVAAECQIRNFAPTSFEFGLSAKEIMTNVFSSPSGLNSSKLVNRVQDGDWFLDEYTATVTEQGFDENYYDLVSKCGPRDISGLLLYDISGKAVSIDEFDGRLYQRNMNRLLPPTINSATFDNEQSSCSPIEVKDGNRTQINRLACNHNIQLSNFSLSYTNSANPKYSISAKAKAAADLKAKQEADAKAAADLKAKQEADAKAAADLKAKQEADAKAAPIKKISITCVKGKITKKVTTVSPKCPAGYKKK
jgi:hypothetical protein